jgi:Fe-S-cluster containining protein
VTKLLLAERVVFTCQNSGACCRNDWLIGVDDASHERLRGVDWHAIDRTLGPGEKFARLAAPLPGGERMTFSRQRTGGCVFLASDERCSIHRHLGANAKPQVCREFPYSFVRTPDGVAVGVSFACTAVRAHQGRPLVQQEDEIAGVLAGSTRVGTLPDPIVLYSSVDISWEQYRSIEAALLDILGHDECSFPVSLVAGSALISLCVGLTQLEARARRDNRRPAETLMGGLEHLRVDRFRRVLTIAAAARYPRRPSLTPLAPLYTWLEFSRRTLSRVGLVAALYRNYLRFRSGRGRLPDFITGGEPFDLPAVQAVRFDTTPAAIDGFLREYWSHVVFRKTLTPMHGVFRGYQTMLVLYAFMKWAAKLSALRAGRSIAAATDVRDAVRIVEQRFVLHARFADIFSLSPVLTVMADRLYQQPSFVRTAALEPHVGG